MENKSTITSTEVIDLLGISRQRFNAIKDKPEALESGPKGVKIFDRKDMMEFLHERYEIKDTLLVSNTEFKTTKKNDSLCHLNRLLNIFYHGRECHLRYNDFKQLPNRGDIMTALKHKRDNVTRPYYYDRVLVTLKGDFYK